MIYFIHDKQSSAIRIGQCYGHRGPQSALANSQGGNPRKLELIAILNHRPVWGDDDPSIPDLSVDSIKAKFRKHRIRGTWFEEEPVLAWLNGGCAAHYLIPDYNFVPQKKRYRKTAG
jgi:hypothetical protein